MDATQFDLSATTEQIAAALQVQAAQVRAAVELLDAGNTIPFIARYRKEATHQLDETALRKIEDLLDSARTLAQRKGSILTAIEEQGKLTPELRQAVLDCDNKQRLEELYLPYKQRRRTRAVVARERGLEPLADILWQQQTLHRSRNDVLQEYVNPANEVPDKDTALGGACDIVAERWAEDGQTIGWLVEQAQRAQIVSKVKRGKTDPSSKFATYFDHAEAVARIPSHRFLAMRRGETEGILRIGLQLDDEVCLRSLKSRLVRNPDFEFHRDLMVTVEDTYQRLLVPVAESTVLQQKREEAEMEAILVFAKNLRELLLAPPAGPRVTLGIDPGFRTGCKVVVVDGTGKHLTHTAIYPTAPKNDTAGAARVLLELIRKYQVELIAIGNGTASRETDAFVTNLLREHELDLTKVIVSESGASIYSASELAVEEYPDLDVTVRGAISIAHRLQDPLSELVKIDPKSIGVGQYQHDVNQTQLKKALDREIESCVNSVGVDLNLASPALLTHVAGIGPKLASAIVAHRDQVGRFESRRSLLAVPKLGKKAFEQAAGFLRIANGTEPLDNSAVHPESYYIVEAMAARLGTSTKQLVGSESMASQLRAEDFVDERAGLPTVRDILGEVAKPGRDPRKQFQAAKFSESVHELTDLKPGLILEGVVTNVTRFGAFVDVGVHQDGLIHISQLADRFVEDPSEIVAVGDVVRVKVLEVDAERRRIALSRRL